jgi:hypothetical protein
VAVDALLELILRAKFAPHSKTKPTIINTTGEDEFSIASASSIKLIVVLTKHV